MSPRTPLTPRDRSRLTERASPELVTSGPIGFRFTEARHGLTPAQVVQANRLLRRLERTRPILEKGSRWQAKMGLRIAGIVSSVKGGRIGSSGWGHRMLATQGGLAMARHAPHVLRANALRASEAARAAKERREAETYYETHGVPLPIGMKPTDTMEQQRLQALNELWEHSQWAQHNEYLRW